MAFVCRICKVKFLASSVIIEDVDSPIVATTCGHLFHRKCLEASVTNQKLSHAMTGLGPLKRYCPAFSCGREIQEHGIIEISTTREPRNSRNLEKEESFEGEEDMEDKLTKKFQFLTSEKERLSANIQTLEHEKEGYLEGLDQINAECEDMRSLLIDDSQINKGDRVFWITKDGTLSPGRIQEMRKKSGQTLPYAVVKLERKMKLPGQGPYISERDTAIVSVDELLPFKSFFKEMFQQFQHKFGNILSETNQSITHDGRQRLLRSKFRDSSFRGSVDSSFGNLERSFSSSHETVNSIPVDALREYREKLELQLQKAPQKPRTKVTRSKTVNLGSSRPRPRTIDEKSRSISFHRTSPLSESDFSFDSDLQSPSPILMSLEPTFYNPKEEVNDEGLTEFIAVGERVIWYDTYSQSPQVGEVAALLEYTPCAIVNFDKLPNEVQIFQYRTVPLDQLFPYDLASPEEKLRIADAYGIRESFMDAHPQIYEDDEEDIDVKELGGDEYCSSSSAEDIHQTIHQV